MFIIECDFGHVLKDGQLGSGVLLTFDTEPEAEEFARQLQAESPLDTVFTVQPAGDVDEMDATPELLRSLGLAVA